MKKTLPIIICSTSVAVIACAFAATRIQNFNLLKADVTTVEGGIVINADNLTVTDSSGSPYQVYFELNSTTKSGYAYSATSCSAGGTDSVAFKTTIDTKKYMFVSKGSYAGGAYYNLDLNLENLYSFTSVVVNGYFKGNSYETYKHTYTPSDTDVVTWEPDLGMAEISLTSSTMFSYGLLEARIESITINYSCLA